ncbi:MAG: hypothetical protein GQ544_00550 [Candidatus Aminicenantes bacterium]|nr:hypothetical protein [Candidatus Aminicenantes bacterium]
MKKALTYLFPLVLIVLLVVPTTLAVQDAKPFVGTWNGAIMAGGMEIGIAVNFTLDDDGKLAGTIDVVEQGAAGLPLSSVKVAGKTVTFMIDDPGAPGEPTFSGTLDDTGKKIDGDFTQGGMEGSFNLEKE